MQLFSFFFFSSRRRHTRFSRDWSSDVCSSDLTLGCSKAVDQDPDRRVQVEWDGKLKQPRPVSVQVVSADKPGILASLSQSFNDLGVNISQANCRSMDDHKAINTFTFAVQDLDQLKTVM